MIKACQKIFSSLLLVFFALFTQTFSFAEPFSNEFLLSDHPFIEKEMGNPESPVVVIEYFSSTCSSCARFHTSFFKLLKNEYIDNNKIRYILRDFPHDNLAFAASMLEHCMPIDNYFKFTNFLLRNQKLWLIRHKNQSEQLRKLAIQGGLSPKDITKCLNNEKLFHGIKQISKLAETKFKVNATPTFFVNGVKIVGSDYEPLKKSIESAIINSQLNLDKSK